MPQGQRELQKRQDYENPANKPYSILHLSNLWNSGLLMKEKGLFSPPWKEKGSPNPPPPQHPSLGHLPLPYPGGSFGCDLDSYICVAGEMELK